MSYARPDSLLEAVNGIYDAATAPDVWRAALTGVVQATRSSSSVLLYFNEGGQYSKVVGSQSIEEELCYLYQTKLGRIDNLHPGFAHEIAGELIDSCCLLGEAGPVRSNVYDKWYHPLDIGFFTGALLGRWRDGWVGISINRSPRQGPHDAQDREAFQYIVPHLQQALRVSESLVASKLQSSLAMEVLSKGRHGVILFDTQCRVIGLNVHAEYLVARNGPLGIDQGRLIARTDGGRSICRALRAISRKEIGSEHIFRMPSPTGFGAVEVQLSRPETLAEIDEGEGGFVMLFRDDDIVIEELQDRLRNKYSLTAAEARVAALSIRCSGVEEIANRLSIGRETARTHLKRIYQKFDVSNYSGLLRITIPESSR